MTAIDDHAPGGPGIPPRWTSSAKSAVGTSVGAASRVWFTCSHGIVDEVYYPRIDTAAIRDFGFLVSVGDGSFLEEKRDARTSVEWLSPGVPGYRLINEMPGIRIVKELLTDPTRDALLQRVVVDGRPGSSVVALLAPHIANRGADNVAWVGDFKGVPMLFAQGAGAALALAVDTGWVARSVGYVGVSDAWQDLHQHGRMTWSYRSTGPGNVALGGEIDVPPSGEFTCAIGFGRSPDEAGLRARASLEAGFETARVAYLDGWDAWHAACTVDHGGDLEFRSRAVLRVHESISFPGATIASLSIPWGFAKGDEDMGGYHLVWPRDMVETLGGLLASGAHADVKRGLEYLRATQEEDGHWPQNMWMDGSPYWGGVQMDETGLPILCVAMAAEEGCPIHLDDYWPMIRKAASFIVLNGPVTPQDRWEEDAGFSPFTVAVQIAAMVTAADIASALGHDEEARLLADTADVWNDSVERWMYVSGTPLADEAGVTGYYVRVAPPEVAEGASPADGWVPIKNRPPGESTAPASSIVSPDALALVRFGLRDARDPRIVDTVTVIDRLLRRDLPTGPSWRRYTDDGYGEHEDGSPFDGIGVGRPWPLLTGERAHYEVAAGDMARAQELFETMRRFAGEHGLLPEQVWDQPAIPERELVTGGPTGSAMPLVWAHAEYLKLAATIRRGRVFDLPQAAAERYLTDRPRPDLAIWAPNLRIPRMRPGCDLRIHLRAPATVRWTADDWASSADTATSNCLGLSFLTLPTRRLTTPAAVEFAVDYVETGWEGVNHRVTIEPDGSP